MSKKVCINEYLMQDPRIEKNTTFANISDIHNNVVALRKISELLKKTKLDFICVPGDTINRADQPNDEILEEMKHLSELAKLYISIGNHDLVTYQTDERGKIYYEEDTKYEFFKELQESANCKIFTEKIETASLDNNINMSALNLPLYYYDVAREDNEYFKKYVEDIDIEVDENAFNILLCHSPNSVIEKKKIITYNDIINKMNLIISGHNHGGLVNPKLQDIFNTHTGFVGPYDKIIQKNAYGVYNDEDKDRSYLVSNGVTKIPEPLDDTKFKWASSLVGDLFSPEIDLIHMIPSTNHTLSLENRSVYKL